MKAKHSRLTKLAAVTAALVASVILAGCTINIGTSNDKAETSHNHGMMNDSRAPMNDVVMFAQMMIPHHQQAVDMGTLAETRASSPEVKALAAKIKNEQAPEITLMKGWLEKAGVDPANTMNDMGHMGHGMDGMLSDAEMTALKAATGTAFDKLYLEGMIAHHEGAISMAKGVVDTDAPELKTLASAIIKSQTEQIAYMKELLAKL